MKRKFEKDKRLESLFSEYVQDEKMPSVSVISEAKEYMNKQRVEEKVAIPATATAGGESSSNSGSIPGNRKIFYAAAIILLATAISLICYFTMKKPVGFDFFADSASVSSEQLSETPLEYSDKSFLPFVNEYSVTEYKEYVLTDEVGSYAEGDVVVYYISFNTSDDISVSVYVEATGIYLEDLDKYKQIATQKELAGITFYFNSDKDDSLCYFFHNDFGYNITIGTNERSVADGILTYISESFIE